MTRQVAIRDEDGEEGQSREDLNAPYGRCGDYAKPPQPLGCYTPLGPEGEGLGICTQYPDCCTP